MLPELLPVALQYYCHVSPFVSRDNTLYFISLSDICVLSKLLLENFSIFLLSRYRLETIEKEKY